MKDYSDAIEIEPKNPIPYNDISSPLLKLGQDDQAIEYLSIAIELDPKLAQAYINLGNIQAVEENYDEAINNINKGIEMVPNGPAKAIGYLNKGAAELRRNRYSDAIDDFTQVIKYYIKQSDKAIGYYRRAIAYQLFRKSNDAIDDLSEAINLKPDYFDAYKLRADIYSENRKTDKAVSDILKCIPLSPNGTAKGDVLGKLALLQSADGRLDDAVSSFKEAIKLIPDNKNIRIHFGNTLLTMAKFIEAINAFNIALEIDSEFAEAINNKGYAYIFLGNYEQALADLDLAITFYSENSGLARAYRNKAICYIYMEQFENAKKCINLSHKLDPEASQLNF